MRSDATQLARVLKALSAPVRVRIVQLLGGQALCVGALAGRLEVTQGAVSQHLRILRDAAIVVDEKRGCFVHYRLNERTLARWRAALDELLTPGRAKRGRPRKGAKTCAAMRRRSARSRRT
jgi:DNA-binding transcriptional ArsR family regulator